MKQSQFCKLISIQTHKERKKERKKERNLSFFADSSSFLSFFSRTLIIILHDAECVSAYLRTNTRSHTFCTSTEAFILKHFQADSFNWSHTHTHTEQSVLYMYNLWYKLVPTFLWTDQKQTELPSWKLTNNWAVFRTYLVSSPCLTTDWPISFSLSK